jgi:deoxyribose-phosphate aldolase
MTMDSLLANLPQRFDHAALQSEVDETAIRRLCDEARQYAFFSVAINPVWTSLAAELLKDSPVKVLSVSGFPLGAARTDVKVVEAVEGVNDGADEIDMVANIGWLCSNRYQDVETEIRKIRRNLPTDILLKVIIEAGKLTEQQQIEATKCVINGGAQFVKTCTGFFGGATVDQVRTLHAAAAGQIAIKASGGIRTLKQCRELLAAGASRLGSSSSVAIVQEWRTAP